MAVRIGVSVACIETTFGITIYKVSKIKIKVTLTKKKKKQFSLAYLNNKWYMAIKLGVLDAVAYVKQYIILF